VDKSPASSSAKVISTDADVVAIADETLAGVTLTVTRTRDGKQRAQRFEFQQPPSAPRERIDRKT
jgi:S1-C subfamily serine protease